MVRIHLAQYGALAQSVEHLTFNQVVRGSNPRCFILNGIMRKHGAFLLLGQGPVFIVEFFADPKNEALKTIIPLAMRVVKLL